MTGYNDFIDELYIGKDPDAVKWFNMLMNKHPETYHHCVRVAMLAEKIAEPLNISRREKGVLIRGCFLHDIGKSMIPWDIINQPGPLSLKQWKIMKLHPVLGAELVEANPAFGPDILDIVRYHHERWDGTGYPDGLKGKEIPFAARVCAVIDAFDSMTSERSYRERKLTISEAKLELVRYRERQFDPEIVDALMDLPEETLTIYSTL
ncbi:HD-GYP domain-containing protein [Paenibacillus puldeungensis]|uniref:HD-GYP domain-containing protein n=1 Tax=Paenibacillus puldeungensis TaxID=696536 RepID=A0ABW3RUM8_9BACL